MAVVIRLTQMGKKGERKYRVAVKEKRSKRDGGAIEYLGWYEKTEHAQKKDIDKARYTYWLSKGAKPSATVAKLME
jgi:small subunit ribosomal protein S16